MKVNGRERSGMEGKENEGNREEIFILFRFIIIRANEEKN